MMVSQLASVLASPPLYSLSSMGGPSEGSQMRRAFFSILIFALVASQCRADDRLAKAFREDRSGWNYVHLEGSPRDVGYQHGSLLAPEIDESIGALKHDVGPKDWSEYRSIAQQP